MFNKTFLKDAGERAASTFAQTILAMVSVLAPLSGIDLLQINYVPVLLVALIAAALSALKSMVAAKTSGTDSASLVTTAPLENK